MKTLYKKDISDLEKRLNTNPDYMDSIIIFSAVLIIWVLLLSMRYIWSIW